jgi:hypothetical protein
MEILRSDFEEYMSYIEEDIKNIKVKYIKDSKTIDTLTTNRQHKLFIKWYNMNNILRQKGFSFYTAEKVSKLASYLINAKFHDLIK